MAVNNDDNDQQQQQQRQHQKQEEEEEKQQKKDNTNIAAAQLRPSSKQAAAGEDSSSVSDDESSDEEDEDLILEGVLERNPDVSDSDDTSSSSEDDDDDDDDDEQEDSKPPPTKKSKLSTNNNNNTTTSLSSSSTIKQQQQQQEMENNNKSKQMKKKNKSKKKKKRKSGPEIVQVDFIFCDMNEKYFHGLKTLLTSTSPIYALNSSSLSDLMIQNVSVGTVVSTETDTDGTIFGFASVLNVTTFQSEPCIQQLKNICLEKCPIQYKEQLDVVLSGKTNRPAGFYLQGRMVNLPLEIVEVLHQQLVLDMDWAVNNAHQDVDRKSLDFGAFVRIAPSYKTAGIMYYKYFDDEIFAQHAEFTFDVDLPKSAFGSSSSEEQEIPFCVVIVLTKSGHREAMKTLSQMVNGGGATTTTTIDG